jgi:uncharacterized protein (TIGR02145 family)
MKKKHILAILALGFIACTRVIAQVPSYVPSSGLVGYWSFDKSFNDISGKGNITSSNGVVFVQDKFENRESACYFNGSSFLSIKDNDRLRPKQITINIMVKPESISDGANPLFYKGGFEVFELDLAFFGIKQKSNCISYSGGGWLLTEKNSNNFVPNTWYMITGSFDGENLCYYVNGKLVKSIKTDIIAIDNCPGGEDFKIGGRHKFDKNFFKGSIDDFGVWNRALSQDEIFKIYSSLNNPISSIDQPKEFNLTFRIATIDDKGQKILVKENDLKTNDEEIKTKDAVNLPIAFYINNQYWVEGIYNGLVTKVKTENGKILLPHGKGQFKSNDDRSFYYDGNWNLGDFSEYGILKMNFDWIGEEIRYQGNFLNGKLNGLGTLTWGDIYSNFGKGASYSGTFVNNVIDGNGSFMYRNGFTYNGDFKNNMRNGKGKLEFSKVNNKICFFNDNVILAKYYDGFWENDIIKGTGKLVYNNDLKTNDKEIIGNWINNQFSGKSEIEFSNGNKYDCEFIQNLPQGNGTFFSGENTKLTGTFKDGRFSGNGKWVYKTGAVFEGDWKDDKYVNGIYKNTNGTYESGIWNEKGEFSGKAKRIAGNKSIWEGEWVGLIPINNGKINFENGNFYEGDWTSLKEGDATYWVIKGKGKMTYPNIGTYEGDFANGIKEGSGDFKYLNGDTYSGDFKNDMKSGIGEMTYKNGTSYRGEWSNDLPNGQGEFLQTDDKVLSGKFVNGVFQKPFICKEVEIGNQVWMAENLTVAKFRNGDLIPQAKSIEEWKLASNKNQPIWCYYEFNDANGLKYGKLYNWYAVNDSRGLAPTGWRIPSPSDFGEMKAFSPENRSYLKDEENPYFVSNNDMLDKIISDIKSKTGWDKNGTNASGFNALPAGFLEFSNVLRKGAFYSKGESTYFWTSVCCTSFDSSASALQLNKYTSNIGGNQPKENCYSVRCIKE